MSPTALENKVGQRLSLSRTLFSLTQFLGKLCHVARVSNGRNRDRLITLWNRKLAASLVNIEATHLMHHQSRDCCLKCEMGDCLTNVVECVPVEFSRRFKGQLRKG